MLVYCIQINKRANSSKIRYGKQYSVYCFYLYFRPSLYFLFCLPLSLHLPTRIIIYILIFINLLFFVNFLSPLSLFTHKQKTTNKYYSVLYNKILHMSVDILSRYLNLVDHFVLKLVYWAKKHGFKSYLSYSRILNSFLQYVR